MMPPSWAEYCTAAAEVTKHNWEFIMKKLSYAKGLQARTIWWQLKQVEVEPIGVGKALDRVI